MNPTEKITPELEYIYLNTIVSLITSKNELNSYSTYEDKKLVEKGALTNIGQIKILMDLGVNPLAPIKISSTGYVDSLFTIASANGNSEAMSLLVNYLNKDNLNNIPEEYLERNIKVIVDYDDGKYTEQLFEKGLRLKQKELKDVYALEGYFIEGGNLEFFETLYYYQPEFDFTKAYWDKIDNKKVSLLDYTQDMLQAETSENVTSEITRKLKNLETFIQSVVSHTNLDNKVPNKKEENTLKSKI